MKVYEGAGDGRRQVARAGRADLHRGTAVQPSRPHARQAAPALVPAGSTEHPAAGHACAARTAEDLTPRQRREATGRALRDVMVDAVFRSKETGRSLFTALLDARDASWRADVIAEDIAARADQLRPAWWWVRRRSDARWPAIAPGETHVALLMPNAIASLVAFMGLQAFGVVPCLLNISAGAAGDAVGLPHRRRPHRDLQPRVRGEGPARPKSWSAWRRRCASSGWRTCARRSACARSCAPGATHGGARRLPGASHAIRMRRRSCCSPAARRARRRAWC